MRKSIYFIALLFALPVLAVAQDHHQRHADNAPQVKSLTEAEVAGYLEGRGMGMAKPAEMNSYPGPMHVLELADKLQLTDKQRTEAERIFAAMRAEAVRLGKQIVEKENELNRLFAGRKATREDLRSLTGEIGRLQAELRAVHLAAHIEMTRELTEEQINAYDQLRGHRSMSHK